MADTKQELAAKLKNIIIYFISGSNAANVVVALVVFLAVIFAFAGAIKEFTPIAYITIILFLLLLVFKPDNLRDNKHALALKKIEQQEKDRQLSDTIEGEIVQPILLRNNSNKTSSKKSRSET